MQPQCVHNRRSGGVVRTPRWAPVRLVSSACHRYCDCVHIRWLEALRHHACPWSASARKSAGQTCLDALLRRREDDCPSSLRARANSRAMQSPQPEPVPGHRPHGLPFLPRKLPAGRPARTGRTELHSTRTWTTTPGDGGPNTPRPPTGDQDRVGPTQADAGEHRAPAYDRQLRRPEARDAPARQGPEHAEQRADGEEAQQGRAVQLVALRVLSCSSLLLWFCATLGPQVSRPWTCVCGYVDEPRCPVSEAGAISYEGITVHPYCRI